MEYLQHTDESSVLNWCRCKSVVFHGDTVTWKLAQSGKYDVLAAYKGKPHLDLIEADSDGALRAFVKQWGPLRRAESGTDFLSWYRQQRNVLAATARLLESLNGPGQREALLALLQSSDRYDPAGVFFRRYQPNASPDDLEAWCKAAPATEIEAVCIRFIEDFPITAMPKFSIEKRGREKVVRASLFINNLLEAIQWMLWQDVSRKEPIKFCSECAGLIRSDNKRVKKFCDWRCAKRNADRKSAARKRASLKKLASRRKHS